MEKLWRNNGMIMEMSQYRPCGLDFPAGIRHLWADALEARKSNLFFEIAELGWIFYAAIKNGKRIKHGDIGCS